jgi:CheY-like chemotaxis protein
MQVLYVDDDRINLMLFTNACASLPGVQLSTAASGAEALELAREQAPQLLVIDLHLTDTDGAALLQALRKAGVGGAPAYLCSADEGPEVQRLARQAGFAGCWSKPVGPQQLRPALAAAGFVPAA